MREQCCSWNNCKEIIEVDGSMDIPGFAEMGGWCDFHDKMYHIEHELFEKLAAKVKGKVGYELANYLWKNDKKAYNKISKRAFRLVDSMIVN